MIDWWTLSVFAAYFAVLLGIAVIRVRPVRTMSDYVLAGRRLGIFTSAMSVGSSTTSGWTFLALPALAFSNGTVVGWTLLSLVVFIWVNWVVIAKRLRRYTIAAGDSLTLPDFYERRFGDTTGVLRTVASSLPSSSSSSTSAPASSPAQSCWARCSGSTRTSASS